MTTIFQTPIKPTLEPREIRKRKREKIAILVLLAVFVLLLIAEFRLGKVSSTLPFVNSIFFFGLVNLNIIILILLLWLVVRNIGKLFIERRRNILGSRLKTKLVVSFLGFSITPTIVLFIISALYINSSFDKWFSLKIQNTLQSSLEITHIYYKAADQEAIHFAQLIRDQLTTKIQASWTQVQIENFLAQQRMLLGLDAIEYYTDPLEDRIVSHDSAAEAPPQMPLDLLDEAFSGNEPSVVHHMKDGDLVRAMEPIRFRRGGAIVGVVVVSRALPVTLVNKVDEIADVIKDYKDINPLKYPVKTAYLLILIMITLVMIFVAIWIGLYMAREMTVPVERLVQGAKAVGSGNLDVIVEASSGQDEIALLIDSFNLMTQDLKESREQLTETSKDLERRKVELEAILANVVTGVIVVDRDGKIVLINPSAEKMLNVDATSLVGKNSQSLFHAELEAIRPWFERAFSAVEGNIESPQISLKTGDTTRSITLVATRVNNGVVFVIDDLTMLLKGQREVAWREVARRIAHEIKNPLTPIKLSAQRLQRQLKNLTGKEGALLRECTEVIINHTDSLKELVNEFTNFARLPEVTPSMNDLASVIEEVLSLYRQAHPDFQFRFMEDKDVPEFAFDFEQIKRVLINLIENSVSAIQAGLEKGLPGIKREIQIDLHYHSELKITVFSVWDHGPGMSEEVLDRIFEPYFSTKKEGTGLGLAITKRIISDHQGFIRVQSTLGEGTKFWVELPNVGNS